MIDGTLILDIKPFIETNIDKEIRAGMTLYGPHREDFSLYLNNKNIKEYGSRGQQRLGAFCLKLSQWTKLKEMLSSSPILLLDDLFSELDNHVRENLQNFLLSLSSQMILTSHSREEFNPAFLKSVNEISL